MTNVALQRNPEHQTVADPQNELNETLDSDLDFQSLMNSYDATKPKALADPTTGPLPDALCKILETWF